MNQDAQPIYFMHYRSRDSYGAPQSTGGATLAIRPAGGNVIHVAIAKCSPRDAFNKKLGRDISAGRLNAFDPDRGSDYVFDIVSPYPSDTPVKEVVASVMGATLAQMGLE